MKNAIYGVVFLAAFGVLLFVSAKDDPRTAEPNSGWVKPSGPTVPAIWFRNP